MDTQKKTPPIKEIFGAIVMGIVLSIVLWPLVFFGLTFLVFFSNYPVEDITSGNVWAYSLLIGCFFTLFMIYFIYFPSSLEKSESKTYLESARYVPQRVKTEVWRRDQGRCVMCGSNQWLEYDHIIPVSKGGSNTARNIQLLCMNCNREKSDKIM